MAASLHLFVFRRLLTPRRTAGSSLMLSMFVKQQNEPPHQRIPGTPTLTLGELQFWSPAQSPAYSRAAARAERKPKTPTCLPVTLPLLLALLFSLPCPPQASAPAHFPKQQDLGNDL